MARFDYRCPGFPPPQYRNLPCRTTTAEQRPRAKRITFVNPGRTAFQCGALSRIRREDMIGRAAPGDTEEATYGYGVGEEGTLSLPCMECDAGAEPVTASSSPLQRRSFFHACSKEILATESARVLCDENRSSDHAEGRLSDSFTRRKKTGDDLSSLFPLLRLFFHLLFAGASQAVVFRPAVVI